jgi:hypothetical protein
MQIDLQELQQRYRDMSEDQLLAIDRDDLTEEAQRAYDYEIKRRKLDNKSFIYEKACTRKDVFFADEGEDPSHPENSACACSFTEHPGSDAARTAAKAMEALQAAGIPCWMTETEEDADEHAAARKTLNVMVPGALIMHATSIVDRDVFNDEYEDEWRAHLQSLSDKELLILNPELFCAGMLDRVARIKKTYAAEMDRRNFKPS